MALRYACLWLRSPWGSEAVVHPVLLILPFAYSHIPTFPQPPTFIFPEAETCTCLRMGIYEGSPLTFSFPHKTLNHCPRVTFEDRGILQLEPRALRDVTRASGIQYRNNFWVNDSKPTKAETDERYKDISSYVDGSPDPYNFRRTLLRILPFCKHSEFGYWAFTNVLDALFKSLGQRIYLHKKSH